jgi:3-oxoacyl-[acyl-carrier protein] reductase
VHYNSAQQPADDLVAELTQLHGIRARAFQADMGDYDSVRAMHAAVVDTLGNPDILFNNAGTTGTVVGKRGDIESVTLDDFEKTWKINTGSSFLVGCTTSFVPRPAQESLCSAHSTVRPSHGISRVWSHCFLFEVGNLPAFILHLLTGIILSVAAGEFSTFFVISFRSRVFIGIGGVIGPHYASSKSALHGLVHWLATRYAKDGIVSPRTQPHRLCSRCLRRATLSLQRSLKVRIYSHRH